MNSSIPYFESIQKRCWQWNLQWQCHDTYGLVGPKFSCSLLKNILEVNGIEINAHANLNSSFDNGLQIFDFNSPILQSRLHDFTDDIDRQATNISIDNKLDRAKRKAKFLPQMSRSQRIKKSVINRIRKFLIRNSISKSEKIETYSSYSFVSY